MNQKLILITYLNNGNFQSQVATEHIFNQVVEDLIEEGKLVESSVLNRFDKRILFDDGSKVMCVPFSMARAGMRFTHVYIDEELQNIPNGKDLIYECILPCAIQGNTNFDLSGDRRFTFSLKDGQVNLKNI